MATTRRRVATAAREMVMKWQSFWLFYSWGKQWGHSHRQTWRRSCTCSWSRRRSWLGLSTLRHAIQNSMEAILACHPALSTKWLVWVVIQCVCVWTMTYAHRPHHDCGASLGLLPMFFFFFQYENPFQRIYKYHHISHFVGSPSTRVSAPKDISWHVIRRYVMWSLTSRLSTSPTVWRPLLDSSVRNTHCIAG